MKQYEEKLKKFICDNDIKAEHLTFNQSCHSVKEAALAVNADCEDFVKNICMISDGNSTGNLDNDHAHGDDHTYHTHGDDHTPDVPDNYNHNHAHDTPALIVAIIKGEDKVDKKKVAEIVQNKVKMAKPSEILEKTGYPCGGTPSFGYNARFLVDERVL